MEQEIQNFLDLNKESFKILHKHIKSIDTVNGVNRVIDFKARQEAIRIINGWLSELWGIAYPELPKEEDEDDIYRTITNQ